MSKTSTSPDAECSAEALGDRLILRFSGRLDANTIPRLWPVATRQFAKKRIASCVIDGAAIEYCDVAGIALITQLRLQAGRMNIPLHLEAMSNDLLQMLDLYRTETRPPVPVVRKGPGRFVEDIGEAFVQTMTGVREHITFLGELASGLVKILIRPGTLRTKDFMRVSEESGAQALPIIGMLGFLIGLILAFQGAVLMKQFAAEIFIADFVGKSVARELGPLITAIIVAGRTGSAFAAEIGTMKVNEEIDALSTMGLDPVRFLVIPRVLAATLMTPLLAILTNLFAMAGGAIVMMGIGFPLITYVNRLLSAVTLTDYLGGLVKALVFGVLIAASGCLCGLRTGEGASAVGNSATRAVVSSIIMIVIADGIFAVVFYILGI